MLLLTETKEESDRRGSVRKCLENGKPGRKMRNQGQQRMRTDKKHKSERKGETR